MGIIVATPWRRQAANRRTNRGLTRAYVAFDHSPWLACGAKIVDRQRPGRRCTSQSDAAPVRMPSGGAQRTWFAEMAGVLRCDWASMASHFQFRYERSNRPTAENRAEETLRAFVVEMVAIEPA